MQTAGLEMKIAVETPLKEYSNQHEGDKTSAPSVWSEQIPTEI